MTLLERIRLQTEGFSTKFSVLAKLIVDNVRDLRMIDMNSSEIARRAGVSEATVTRFVHKLGYSNFSEFRMALRQQLQASLSVRSFRMEQYNGGEEPVYVRVFNLERSLMEETLGMLDPVTFDKCVDILRTSEELLIVACEPYGFLADYFYSFLRLYRDRIHIVRDLDLSALGKMIDGLSKKTSAFVISFPRYPQETQRIVKLLHNRSMRIVGITDSEMSPIVPFSSYTLFTPHKYLIVTDPVAAAVSLIHSLLVGFYKKDPSGCKKRLQKYEDLANESDIYVHKNFSFAEML
ncbi:MAG TPA: hypothetical protein DIC53_04925 [Synergistaceae bacterium]|jgi:DNA-binding MurR/RpiR family transcriptional regulator|nr:hypothetical protein [Synergistaceae bacterium]